MNFKEGEVLYFDKPLRWTSFAVVNTIPHQSQIRSKENKSRTCWHARSAGHWSDDYLYRKGYKAY